MSLTRKNLADRQKVEIAKGYRRLCKAVLDIALSDLQHNSVLRDEAAYFFESEHHLSLICHVAGADTSEIYAAYKAIRESDEALGITVTKDGLEYGRYDTIAEAASASGLGYRTAYGMLNGVAKDGWRFTGLPKKGAKDIEVLKDGKYVCTVPNITGAMNEVSLCYQSVISLLSSGRKSRSGYSLRYRQ